MPLGGKCHSGVDYVKRVILINNFYVYFLLIIGSIVNRSNFIRAVSGGLAISCAVLILGGNTYVSSEIIKFLRADSSVEESF